MPRVSVAMSVYNGAAYLREAVDSILSQTYDDFEFIIVNDGSSDDTAALLATYSDPRIRVLNNDRNLGLARSLNRALDVASGEFVARQDADDISEPERLRRQVDYLDGHADVALVGSAHVEIDAGGRERAVVDAHCDHLSITWAMLFFCPFAHTAVMFRREPVLRTVGGYDESYHYSMDYELWTRIADHFRVANLPEPLVRLRMHDSSMTTTFGTRTAEGQRLRIVKVAQLLRLQSTGAAAEQVHAVLSALVFGPPTSVNADELLRALNQMFALQTAFAEIRSLTPHETAAHRAELRRHLGLTLIRYARDAAHRDDVAAATVRRLILRALRVYPRLVTEPSAVREVLRLLTGDGRARGRVRP